MPDNNNTDDSPVGPSVGGFSGMSEVQSLLDRTNNLLATIAPRRELMQRPGADTSPGLMSED
jgi:hypothetical protein